MKIIRSLLQKAINLKTQRKLLISYILVGLIPLLLVSLTLTNGIRQIALKVSIREATVNVERLEKRMAEILTTIENVSNKIYTGENFNAFISNEYESTIDIVEAYKAFEGFDYYKGLYREIGSIKFYTFNKTIVDNGEFEKITEDLKKEPWYQNAIKKNGKMYWSYIEDENMKQRQLFSLIRLVKSVSGKHLGILFISVNQSYLQEVLEEESFETMLVDQEGRIIASKSEHFEGQNLRNLELEAPSGWMEEGAQKAWYQGEESQIVVNNFKPEQAYSQLKVISIFPIESIENDVNRNSMPGVYITVLSFILALILIFIFSNLLSKRVRRLSSEISKVSQGDFDTVCTLEGNDEIGLLAKDFNSMIKSIKQLVHEVYEVNLEKKQLDIRQREIEFKMLANQINPHFLFNALEAIRMNAHCNRQDDIAEAVKQLGKIIRRSLEVGKEPIPLEAEMDFVKSYLEIQKFRFGDRINYQINIPEEAMDFKILPLIIQPIVENAVIHGLENKEKNGIIQISLEKQSGIVGIFVEDNGVGMEEGKLRMLELSLNSKEESSSKRIGIRNVHQRIQLYYGGEYGLQVYSKLGQGTRVGIILPERLDRDVESTGC